MISHGYETVIFLLVCQQISFNIWMVEIHQQPNLHSSGYWFMSGLMLLSDKHKGSLWLSDAFSWNVLHVCRGKEQRHILHFILSRQRKLRFRCNTLFGLNPRQKHLQGLQGHLRNWSKSSITLCLTRLFLLLLWRLEGRSAHRGKKSPLNF